MQNGYHTHFDTYTEYRAAFSALLGKARKRIWIGEHTLQESGLDSLPLYDTLLKALTQDSPITLRILVSAPDHLLNHCPRIMQLRDHFAHLIEIRTLQDAPGNWQQGIVLVDEDDYLVRRHFDWPKGEWGNYGRESAILEHLFDQLWMHATPPSDPHRVYL